MKLNSNNFYYIMDAYNCLVLLQNNTIDTIYIDPPYNTKNKNFEYNDDNNNWEKDIYKVINEAYLKLKDTGVIFISIDDNMFCELKMICDKIFLKSNFLGNFITKQATRSNSKTINTIHEYVLCYAKDKTKVNDFKVKRVDINYYKNTINSLSKLIKDTFVLEGHKKAEQILKQQIKVITEDENFNWIKNYHNVDENGDIFFAKDLSTPSNPSELHIKEINITLPKLRTRGWVSKQKIIDLYNNNLLIFKKQRPYEKHYIYDSYDSAMSILNYYSRQGTNDLKKLGLHKLFSTPKPVELIKFLIQISTKNDGVVLDFFAGSGTTAHAVLELNQEEKSNRSFIICQRQEKIINNKESSLILKENNLQNDISSIPIIRLDRLKLLYNFDYKIIRK